MTALRGVWHTATAASTAIKTCHSTHADSIEDQVYVHLHKCSPTAAAPEGAGPASEAAGEGNDEALGTALDDIMEGE